jgi:hypothetical protein
MDDCVTGANLLNKELLFSKAFPSFIIQMFNPLKEVPHEIPHCPIPSIFPP